MFFSFGRNVSLLLWCCVCSKRPKKNKIKRSLAETTTNSITIGSGVKVTGGYDVGFAKESVEMSINLSATSTTSKSFGESHTTTTTDHTQVTMGYEVLPCTAAHQKVCVFFLKNNIEREENNEKKTKKKKKEQPIFCSEEEMKLGLSMMCSLQKSLLIVLNFQIQNLKKYIYYLITKFDFDWEGVITLNNGCQYDTSGNVESEVIVGVFEPTCTASAPYSRQCCVDDFPCAEGGGNCATDDHCQGDLVCGTCPGYYALVAPEWIGAHCCEEPEV